MKPFITPELLESGKKKLPIQWEGINSDLLCSFLKDQYLVACAFPKNHSLKAAWIFWLIFQSGKVLEFSSACTQVVGWEEVGSLNIGLLEKIEKSDSYLAGNIFQINVQGFIFSEINKLIYEDEDLISECGLVLISPGEQEVVIAAGIPPGSVSIKAWFQKEELFEPQFPLSICRYEVMGKN